VSAWQFGCRKIIRLLGDLSYGERQGTPSLMDGCLS
jgi:hypothetical protein